VNNRLGSPTVLISLALSACSPSAALKEKAVSGQSYAECIKTLLEPSFVIMDRMEAQGVDLNKPRLITHLLAGPDESITKAAQYARKQGFEISEQSEGRLIVTEEAPVIEDWIKHTIPVFCSFAAEYGLTYDGWDVDMSKDSLKRE
jgi:regulator of RNase E activity RraB